MSPADERQQSHELLDMLPDDKMSAVRALLEVMVEPLSDSLANAPVDDEELAPEVVTLLQQRSAGSTAGNDIAHGEVKGEFGFKK
jgi:hypothetical protein